jgi:hypothetical protein
MQLIRKSLARLHLGRYTITRYGTSQLQLSTYLNLSQLTATTKIDVVGIKLMKMRVRVVSTSSRMKLEQVGVAKL